MLADSNTSTGPAGRVRTLKNPLPEGTLPVGVGLLISGICLYGVITIASRGLGKALDAPFAVFWPVLFVCGPGFFLPLEQEVGRALAARHVRGEGGGPLITRAATFGGVLCAVLVLLVLAFGSVITTKLFDGYVLMLVALAGGLVAYYAEHLTRGTLSGNGRFRAYGELMGAEGIFRVAGCLALWKLFNNRDPSLYALAMVIGSMLAVIVALRGQRKLVVPGPPAPWTELSSALGFLLATSVLNQLLTNIGPIAVKLLATSPAQEQQTGPFLNGLIISRVPLFLFQAVQAALLPKLAGLASAGEHRRLRRALTRLVLFVVGLGVVATIGAFLLGPFVIRVLFGPAFELGREDLGLLALASSLFMLAIVFTQALIALHGYWRALVGAICGSVGFVIVTALCSGLFRRIEFGLVAGAVASTVVMLCLLLPLVPTTEAQSDAAADELIEGAVHSIAEP